MVAINKLSPDVVPSEIWMIQVKPEKSSKWEWLGKNDEFISLSSQTAAERLVSEIKAEGFFAAKCVRVK